MIAMLTFLGLFWNTYFTSSSIFKCFIPASAFKENGKYFSVIPEKKHEDDDWLSVTIQIPVYKESLDDVLAPTLQSCIQARAHYESNSTASCNIVVCDDGMMNMLRDNFSAAEMLWENINETKGRVPIKVLLQKVPRAARRHLSGLRSKNIKEVFNRMIFYYHNKIGFVARSTLDRRGKFKKASNINTHLRLVFGAQQITEETGKNFEDALLQVGHNDDGSRDVMFGGNVAIGELIIINDADARMSAPVILKTVPEFLNDKKLGFTQHATKTLDDQRGESCYLNMIEVYTDMLYQGHFLMSSIMGCNPPLVGHSIFLRTTAVRQCGRLRMLRKAQRWLNNIGLPFVGVDNVGFSNLQSEDRTEYWSESHVSEDFELMIHLYNIGYTGRYIAFPDCEFQEGVRSSNLVKWYLSTHTLTLTYFCICQVTRTFDEEAGRHRKFALGGFELMFNPFQDWFGHGILTPIFKTFLTCDIPSYYKIFLTSYLLSYTSGGVYIVVFTIAATARLLDTSDSGSSQIGSLYKFSPASILILNIVVYYVIGYTCFIIATCRMRIINKDLFFPQYRKRGILYLIWKELRYCMTFQILFYTVMGNYFFLGGVDHLMSRSRICGATNKDPVSMNCFTALYEIFKFNSGSWAISCFLAILALATVWKDLDYTIDPEELISTLPSISSLLFAGPTVLMSIFALVIPIIMNPYVWGCYRRVKPKSKPTKAEGRLDVASVVGSIDTRMYSPKTVKKKTVLESKPATSQKHSKGRKSPSNGNQVNGKTEATRDNNRTRLTSV